MKLFLLQALSILTILLSSHPSFGQQDTVYFNEKWKKTDRLHANYYRYVKKVDGKFSVEDYYLEGTVQMKGTYTSLDTPDMQYRDGLFTYYYPSGKVENDGNCVNGKRNGMWTHFNSSNEKAQSQISYKNGIKEGDATFYDTVTQKIKTEGHYTNDTQSGKWTYYNTKGKIREESIYTIFNGDVVGAATFYNAEGKKTIEGELINGKRSGLWKVYNVETGTVSYEQHYINGLLDGEMTGYYQEGKIRRKEFYAFGKMTSGKCYSESGKEIDFFPAEKMPVPTFDIPSYLDDNLKYPGKARRQNIQGRVVVKFVVSEDGTISNVEVVEGIGGGCNEEAIRVMQSMPAWEPGTLEGKPVKVFFTQPITFKLTD